MYIAPIVGYVDALGYLRCTDCHPDNDTKAEGVYQDCGWSEPCDKCGKIVGRVLPPHGEE